MFVNLPIHLQAYLHVCKLTYALTNLPIFLQIYIYLFILTDAAKLCLQTVFRIG